MDDYSTLEDFVNLKTNWRTLRRFSDDLIEKGEIKLFWPIEEKEGNGHNYIKS